MYDWTAAEKTSRLRRQELTQEAAKGRVTDRPGGDLERYASPPSAIGWELARHLGRARKLLRRLPARV